MDLENAQDPFECNPAEADDHSGLCQLDLTLQIRLAIREFLRSRTVGWWSAARCCGEIQTFEPEAVITGGREWAVGVACTMESREEEVPGSIAGELSSCPIGTVGTRSQPYNQHACMGIPEARDGFAPILPIPVGTPLPGRHGLTPSYKPGALTAGGDLPV